VCSSDLAANVEHSEWFGVKPADAAARTAQA
jgi:hypothetical protein